MVANRFVTGKFALALMAASLSAALHAQTAPPPGTVLKQNTPPARLPEAPQSVIALPAQAQQRRHATTPIAVTRILLTGNHLIPTARLRLLVQTLEGRTVTLAALDRTAERITALYQSRGYPLANAYVPAQTIRDGIVHIAVVEPRYDRIDIDDHARLSAATARHTLGLTAGQTIARGPLDRGLLLLDRTPGVRVAGTFIAGARPDTSTLQVRVRDTPLLHAQLHVDNDGSEYTGRTRSRADVSLDNPFGHGAQLAVNGMTTAAGLLHAGGFNVTSPNLVNGLRAGIYGSRTVYRLGGAFADLALHGRVNQLGLDLDDPLVLQPGRLLSIRLDLLRNGLEQRSRTIGNASRSHLRVATLSLDGAWADRFGGLTSGGLSVTRGTLVLDSADARSADAAGARAAGPFWLGQLQLQRRQPLPAHWTLRLRLSAQLASHALDGSERFYLGGPSAVMSAPVNAGGGDAGAVLDLRLAHPLPMAAPQHLQAALLLQGGRVWLRRSATAGAQSQHLSGAGLGLDYRFRERVRASLAYVHALGRTDHTHTHAAWWVRLTIDL